MLYKKLSIAVLIVSFNFFNNLQATGCASSDQGLLKERSTSEVFMDHLRLRYLGDIECDLERNYSPNIIMVENYGIFHGFDGVRESARILNELVPTKKYKMDNLVFNDNNAFEAWTVDSDGIKVTDGIDAFIIRKGKIEIQTVYYTVTKTEKQIIPN